MNTTIQKALKHLENANYAGYFEELDKISLPAQFRTTYAEHKGKFISGSYPYNFHQQLEVFSKAVDKQLVDMGVVEMPIENTLPTNFKDTAYALLDDGNLSELIKFLLKEGRGKDWYSTITAINVSFKEYENEKLIGANTAGRLETITHRLTLFLNKL